MSAKLLFPPGRRGKTAVENTEQKMVSVINELQSKSCQFSGEKFTFSGGSQERFRGRGDFEADLEGWKSFTDAGKGRVEWVKPFRQRR